MNAFWRALSALVSLGSHSGFVISERYKSSFRTALIQPLPILNRAGPGLPLVDGAAQGLQERSLLDGIAVSVLGQQPCRAGAFLTGQRPPWPAPGAENFRKPPGVFLVYALPFGRYLVREPGRVLSLRRGHQSADPLILITPDQQLPPQFFIHAAIPS